MTGRSRFSGIDPRIVIGTMLIVASVVGVWAVVDSADRSSPVYIASETLSVGDTVSEENLEAVHVRLEAAGDRYLSRMPDANVVITRTVLKGEFVPLSSVKSGARVQVSAVVIESATRLPGSVEPGSLVDVWAAEQQDDGSFAPPVVVVGEASVVRVVEQQGLVAGAGGSTVEVLIPTGSVASMLAAIAGQSSISIVPAG